ncbi:hypothetical protein P154DRAFT_527759 [Amniculicola lignicola CBS 123094]|uniref:FAD-binding FR-type domain-containing protein n=1 Tax=Amniculicola lignicola CBS 123094 TaxID=1392246 RepID=A0A6A5VXP1_9PLEO|nr:hypothetical protein P154DRAFT_527759 [Amniculicola lignicola CBS 123094]
MFNLDFDFDFSPLLQFASNFSSVPLNTLIPIMAFSMAMPWNSGEEKMHHLLHVPEFDNPTSTMLTPQAVYMLQRAPLLAIGTLDSEGRPWTSVWGGQSGFSQPVGGGMVGTRTIVDGVHDPVVQALTGGTEKGEMVRGEGKLLSGLALDLMNRKRVKIFGLMVAGALGEVTVEGASDAETSKDLPEKQDQLQLVYKVEQSLGNCPKYMNQYELRPTLTTAKLVEKADRLGEKAKELVKRSDMFFLSSSTDEDMDTNHRGGPPGFVRVISDTEIVYPEYSGNRLYQTLGNLQINPRVGITFPDYETGDILYVTGEAEILVLDDAAKVLPGSNLALKIKIAEARLVEGGLPFRGERKGPSPYNPLVRTLVTEGNIKGSLSGPQKFARLIKKTKLTPTISRFTFSVSKGINYAPGQWVALDFSKDMYYGYSHMRDDDPQSLNDDFVRTFTISSTPTFAEGNETEFDITIRKVGPVTSYLLKQNDRAGFEIPILGVGGEFKIEQEPGKLTPFIAGGVGITPLLGQIQSLDITPETFKLYWTVRKADIELVIKILEQYPQLAKCTEIFLTGTSMPLSGTESSVKVLAEQGVGVWKRRMEGKDLEEVKGQAWFLCAGRGLRKSVVEWAEGGKVLFEDFDY